MFASIVFALCVSINTATGSQLVLSASPTEVLNGLTPSLTLRCGLNDTAASADIVGKRQSDDVTSTSYNVDDVTSVILMHNGKDVASVTKTHPAHSLQNATGVQVIGDLSGASGERGYLQMTIPNPGKMDVGSFECEINTSTATGHTVRFSSALEIGSKAPEVSDLVAHIRNLEQVEIPDLKHQIKECCEKHTEAGVLECGPSSGWTTPGAHPIHGWYRLEKSITHSFRKPYSKPPVVTLGVYEMDTDHTTNVRFNVHLASVDQSGFTILCQTHSDSVTYNLGVSWLSASD